MIASITLVTLVIIIHFSVGESFFHFQKGNGLVKHRVHSKNRPPIKAAYFYSSKPAIGEPYVSFASVTI